ncbi:uncharacterized protein EDB91DRAFT_206662 [Suillus paluster]|uniref:uncharacterized protein n=1 Tax=Suillus paluster TaxID=48578 RepID=UPI001B86AC01|nr:uncharacterized protein EDB91DRAFT_206662 [Suillus paluster]KAG1743990.1 hypothetical protein EDB91DRAFT_206662 [Suillus paluster]
MAYRILSLATAYANCIPCTTRLLTYMVSVVAMYRTSSVHFPCFISPVFPVDYIPITNHAAQVSNRACFIICIVPSPNRIDHTQHHQQVTVTTGSGTLTPITQLSTPARRASVSPIYLAAELRHRLTNQLHQIQHLHSWLCSSRTRSMRKGFGLDGSVSNVACAEELEKDREVCDTNSSSFGHSSPITPCFSASARMWQHVGNLMLILAGAADDQA